MIRIYAEIADTEEKRAQGLMYRRRLSADSGMLFDFKRAQALSFWMKNTEIPLDIAFIDDDFRIREIKSMVPGSTKSVRASGRYRYALEMNEGWFDRNGIGVGSVLKTARQISLEEALEETPPMDEVVQPTEMPQETPSEEKRPEVKPSPDVIVNMSFMDAVRLANDNSLSIAFDYEFPEGNINSYVLVPVDKYEIKQGRGGNELVSGRCRHSGGEYRNFIIDNVIQFDLYHYGGENDGIRVETPAPTVMFPQPEIEASRLAPAVKLSSEDIEMMKSSQSYSGGSQLMMTEYWDEIKKKKGKGKSEGQAILDYLAENSRRNSPKKKKKKSRSKKKK